MKVLLLAPQPFYADRGTPIAVDLVLRTLSARGDAVDLLTYHLGADRAYPGVHLRRIPRMPFIRAVRPGPSIEKLCCDAVFSVVALWTARRGRYDLVHAVEESVFIAWVIKRWLRIPYLYDMDSSLAEQVTDRYRWLQWLRRFLQRLEALAIRDAEVVVPVCDALETIARRHGAGKIVVLRDVSLLTQPDHGMAARSSQPPLREELGLQGPIVMYIGNLEPYQGAGLLLEGFAAAHRTMPEARLVVIGGRVSDVARYREQALRLGLDSAVQFLGPRPVGELRRCLEAADILVSPRLKGTNTPMKIYSYLDSGKPVLATNLPTHTQVLTEDVAVLAAPTPEAIAEGLVRLLEHPEVGRRLGERARQLVAERYSYRVFEATLQGIYAALASSHREDGQ